jgi:hypothetical protein
MNNSSSYDFILMSRLLLCILFTCLMWCLFMLYYVCIVLMRVDEQAIVESEVQNVEVAEQELIEGKLCPWSLTFSQPCSY